MGYEMRRLHRSFGEGGKSFQRQTRIHAVHINLVLKREKTRAACFCKQLPSDGASPERLAIAPGFSRTPAFRHCVRSSDHFYIPYAHATARTCKPLLAFGPPSPLPQPMRLVAQDPKTQPFTIAPAASSRSPRTTMRSVARHDRGVSPSPCRERSPRRRSA